VSEREKERARKTETTREKRGVGGRREKHTETENA